MRKMLFLLWGVLSIVLLTSCEQNDKEDFANNSNQVFNFKYEGQNYCCNYQMINGEVVCNDKQVQQVYSKLANNPNLATLINEDGSLEYFDSYEELIEYLNKVTPVTKQADMRAAGNARSTVGLYADINYRGENRSFVFNTPGQQTGAAYADLSTIGLLNKISSVKVGTDYFTPLNFNSRITLYEQRNFKGYSITWQTVRNTKNPINVPDLSKIYRRPAPSILTWDNAAQSARIGFITDF